MQASAWLFLETLGQPWVWRRGWGSSYLELGERRMVSAELRAVAVVIKRRKKFDILVDIKLKKGDVIGQL